MKKLIEDLVLFFALTSLILSYFLALFLFIFACYFLSLPTALLISLIYGTWMYIDRYTDVRGGRWSNYLRRLSMWTIVSNYFPVKLIKTVDLDPNRNYIFGYHPHGLVTVGAIINFLTEATNFSILFPGIRPHLMILRIGFLIPFTREFILNLGACRVSRESCQYFLNGSCGLGNAVTIVIGGEKELALTEYRTMVLYLKKRKGFIRLALENGAALVPIISFGENEHYRRYKNWISNRCIWGRSIIPYIPLRHPVTTVVGKPIDVNQIIDPSQTDIDQLHCQYIQAVEQLYDTHKATYGFEHVKLEII